MRGSVLRPSDSWRGREELSQQDLEAVCQKLHLPASRVQEIFALVDTDGVRKQEYNPLELMQAPSAERGMFESRESIERFDQLRRVQLVRRPP